MAHSGSRAAPRSGRAERERAPSLPSRPDGAWPPGRTCDAASASLSPLRRAGRPRRARRLASAPCPAASLDARAGSGGLAGLVGDGRAPGALARPADAVVHAAERTTVARPYGVAVGSRFCDELGREGFGWIVDESLTRSSHALAANGRVWLVDPIDWPDAVDRALAL